MRLPKFRYVLLVAAILGVVIPLVLMSLIWLRILDPLGGRDLFLWPGSIILLATKNVGHSLQAFAILGLSIGCNVLLYVIGFTLFWSLGWVFGAWRRSYAARPRVNGY